MLLAALALAAPPDRVVYHIPADADPKTAEPVRSAWAVKDRLYVATPTGELYEAAGAASKVVAKLATGTAVEVMEVGTVVDRVGGRMDGWYRVEAGDRAGWMHGSQLTPFAWRDDFDGDGGEEVITVFMEPAFAIRVLVYEPELKAGQHSWLDLDPAGQAFMSVRGGEATAEHLKAKVASIPLVHVHSGPEACSDYADWWVSYRSPGPGRMGLLRVALETAGMTDPPVFHTPVVELSGSRKIAVVTTTSVSDEGQEPTVQKVTWKLIDGVYYAERDGKVDR